MLEVPQNPKLSIDTETISLGEQRNTEMSLLRNTGTGELTRTVESEESWLPVSPIVGTTLGERTPVL